MVNVCGGLVSPPFSAVPPLSCARTVTSDVPVAFSAGVKVSVPVDEVAGLEANNEGLVTSTRKSTIWPASFGGPGLMFVAQLGWEKRPELRATRIFGPAVKLGGIFPNRTITRNVWLTL